MIRPPIPSIADRSALRLLSRALLATYLAVTAAAPLAAQPAGDEDEAPGLTSGLLSSMRWRSIGPAVASGRIADIAIDPTDRSVWYVAASSGGVWKTTNAGTTWDPIFDSYGSYSIGAIALDPSNHLTLWVGSGENNGQRSVGYGDGIYRSIDGGRSFENMGLETSRHIGMVAIHPDDSDVVYVAAIGNLWASGGERGLYRTTDGGETWEAVLEIDEHTGVHEVYFDPRNPDWMYAVAWQRRRHQWTMIDGGPGSGIYKSTDGGDTWREIDRGLPGGDKGRIGMAISPQNPDVLYAIVEANGGGTYRSDNMGESWRRTSSYQSGAAMYYHELYADPHRYDRIYAHDTFLQMSEDGGETWGRLPTQGVHVDFHAMAFDPDDPEHLLVGNDGGLYETFDFGGSWKFFSNLPLTQFYKVATSNDEPFYYVYGGTQDNNTLGGPSQTLDNAGIRNSDWYVTLGGDGFDPVVDYDNPDIIYSQLQHGVLSRFDRGSKERLDIQPQESADGPPLRWYWDAGLHMSPHDSRRLYFGAQILFQTDDMASTWRPISGDLTRNIDRNQLEVMGRVWSVDAVAKNRSTSVFGHIVSISESPLVEGLIYVGTDDGLIQVTEDGGGSWREIGSFPGVPDTSFVHDVEASLHDPNTVFAVINNFKRGDFSPYVLRSTDRGVTWTQITGDLPEGPAFSIVQDHVEPNLLFLGTEYSAFTSVNGGQSWLELSSGLPTIPVRELEIQKRENDLVAATFGRSFYVIDDYTPLRELAARSDEILAMDGHIFPVTRGDMYLRWSPGGAEDYAADNPSFGVTFTYFVGETLRTRQAERQAEERRLAREGEDTPYPTWDELEAEDREEAPEVFLTIRDAGGNVVNTVDGSTSRGIHRATWNYRYPGYNPVTGGGGFGGFGGGGGFGPLALPGSYTVSLSQRVDGVATELVGATPFEIAPMVDPAIPPQDPAAVLEFQRETGQLLRAVTGTQRVADAAMDRIRAMKQAVAQWPEATEQMREDVRALELRMMDLDEILNGSRTRASRSEPEMPGIVGRVNQVVRGHWQGMHGPTNTHREQYRIAYDRFSELYPDMRELVETDLPALEARLEAVGAPWTTGRALPDWPPR
ncbi:MAG: glycosyl hydrolase [Gemmatimonadota bacterium]|nr:glycosyl hydrolase [Gemmatimonadota bacterium]